MKHWILLILLSALGVCSLSAQTMSSLFISMPQHLTVYLDGGIKHDLVALWNDNRKATITNLMNGHSTLKVLSKDHFFLQSTESSSLEGKLLTVNDTTQVICLISTVYTPVPDSRITFYTKKWQKLKNTDYFIPPVWNDFLIKKTDVEYKDAYFLQYTFVQNTSTLSVRLASLDYMIEHKAIDSLCVKKEIFYTWEEGKLKKE